MLIFPKKADSKTRNGQKYSYLNMVITNETQVTKFLADERAK